MREYKILGVGLDCSTLSYRPSPEYLPENLFYDTSSNNFQCIKGMTKGKNMIIRVGVSDEGIIPILSGLGLGEIDVLLLPPSPIEPDLLKEVLNKFGVKSVGIDRPKDLEQLKDAAESIKRVILPSYVSLDLSPIQFNVDIMKWIEGEGLGVLGLNPFGGFLSSPVVIQSFTIPFLLSFSAAYSEVVILSGRDLMNAKNNSEFLYDLIGEEIEEGLVEMKNSINHLVKPLPKIIHSGLRLEDDSIIPYDNPEYISDPTEIILKMDKIEDEGEDQEKDDVMRDILNYDYLILPVSPSNDPQTNLSIILPSMLSELEKSRGCKTEVIKLGSLVFLIKVVKEEREKRYLWFDKVWEENTYYILRVDDSGEIKINHYALE